MSKWGLDFHFDKRVNSDHEGRSQLITLNTFS